MSCALTQGRDGACLFWHQLFIPPLPVSASVLCNTRLSPPGLTQPGDMTDGFLVWVKTDCERHKTLHNDAALSSLLIKLTLSSVNLWPDSPVTAPRLRPRQMMRSLDMAPGPVTSLMISLASWRPLIGREPRYWPLIGQQLVTITQSADMSLTAQGGKCTSCCDKNIESLNSLCAALMCHCCLLFSWLLTMCFQGIPQKIYLLCVVPGLVL